MKARDAVDTETIDRDEFAPPQVSPWRLPPTREQKQYAADLCRSELAHPERTIDRFPTMSRYEMSSLIRSLKVDRARRLASAPRDRRWRLVL